MMIALLTVYIALLNQKDFLKRDLSALKIGSGKFISGIV